MDQTTQNTHYLLPGNLFVNDNPYVVTTILGSCVAVALIDPVTKVGGINHYMMPFWGGDGLPTPKYGNIAIGKLLEKVLSYGAVRSRLKAKIFGGASLYWVDGKKNSSIDIGGKNILFAERSLAEEGIPIISSDTGGNRGRRILFFTDTGVVRVRMLANSAIDGMLV